MNLLKAAALVLILAGIVGLAYGGFSYTKDTTAAQLGPITLTVKDQHHVNVPVWAGIAAIVVGAGLLLVPPKKA